MGEATCIQKRRDRTTYMDIVTTIMDKNIANFNKI